MQYIAPEAAESGLVGVMNTHFIGEAWANWGYFGLFLSPIWVGSIIQIIIILLFRMTKTPINLALITFFTIYLGMNITGGFIAYIYNAKIISLIVIIFIINSIKENLFAINNN